MDYRQKVTSGTVAKATTGDDPVELIAAQPNDVLHHVRIINEGAAPGFYSIDGGNTWERLPAQASISDDDVIVSNTPIMIKRVSGGTDLSGIFASTW
jgi:hypothetical protein